MEFRLEIWEESPRREGGLLEEVGIICAPYLGCRKQKHVFTLRVLALKLRRTKGILYVCKISIENNHRSVNRFFSGLRPFCRFPGFKKIMETETSI